MRGLKQAVEWSDKSARLSAGCAGGVDDPTRDGASRRGAGCDRRRGRRSGRRHRPHRARPAASRGPARSVQIATGDLRRVVDEHAPTAIETAAIVAPVLGGLVAIEDCELCELHTGDADGITWDEYREQYGATPMREQPHVPFAPGGESLRDFDERTRRVLGMLAERHPDDAVLMVAHGGLIDRDLAAAPRPLDRGRRRLGPRACQHLDHRMGHVRESSRTVAVGTVQRRRAPRGARTRYPGVSRAPQVAVADWPGSRRMTPSPERNASGGLVMGSEPRPRRCRDGARVSPL